MAHLLNAKRVAQWLLLSVMAFGFGVGGRLFAQKSPVTDKDVLPIVQRCTQCHGGDVQMGNLDLRTRASILQGGNSGAAINPGHADDSLLIKRVTGLVKPQMPMSPVPQLKPEEIAVLKDWINQGALGSADNGIVTAAPAAPGIPADLSYPPANFPGYKERVIQDRDREWWAFKKPVRYPSPAVSDARWSKNPIDAFVKKELDAKGLEPAPQADKRTLIRRVYLDLIGLLPPTEAVEAFVKDDSPDAYSKLVDKLLASPNYGERWGRFWLDVVRYADSSGFEYDRDIPNAWRYRDYVIKAFNEDKPFNQFIVEQIAGDELDNPTNDSLTATTFYRIGPRVRFREKQNPSNRYDYMDDMIRTTFQGFMGLSVNCARCHDHKFDPITRMDYYRSMAMMWGYVDYDQPLAPKSQVEQYEKVKSEVAQETAPLRAEIARIEKPYRDADLKRRQEEALQKYPEDIRIAVQTPPDKRTPGQKLLVSQLPLNFDDPDAADVVPVQVADNPNGYRQRSVKVSDADEAKRKELQAKIKEIEKRLPPPLPMANGVRDGDYWLTPDDLGDNNLANNGRFAYDKKCCFVPAMGTKYEVPELHFAANGADFEGDKKTPEVQPGFLTVLVKGTPPPTSHLPNRPGYPTSGRRRALGEWIASPDNPLTSRVIVNRIWGWHFGTAIVPTPGNFGRMGLPPSNPELLDWLATEFIRQGWSIKQMHRLIMNSETYRMASSFYRPEDAKKDPTNVYLWKFPLHRVEAEIVHDIMLSASGQLNMQFGGKPFFPSVPESVRLAQPRGIWQLTKEGPDTWRRGVYAYVQRGLRYPMFEVFDEPDLNITCERRDVSTVPTQALTLLNNNFMLIQSKFLAQRILKEASSDPAERIKQMYRVTLSREPTGVELNLNLGFLQKQREYALAHGAASGDAADLAAMTDLAQVILDSDEFVYIG